MYRTFSLHFPKAKAMQFCSEASSGGRCSVFLSNWTARLFPLLPLCVRPYSSNRLHYLKGCKSQYIRKLLFWLFSTKFSNNLCKRCNLPKRKLNVAKFTYFDFRHILVCIGHSKEYKRELMLKLSSFIFSWTHNAHLPPFPTFETGSVCNPCQDKRRRRC